MMASGIGKCPFTELESQELLFKEMREMKSTRKAFLNPKGETVFYYLVSKLIEANKYHGSPVRFCFHCYSFKTKERDYYQRKDNETLYISVSLSKIFSGNELEETMYASRWRGWLLKHKAYFLHIGVIRMSDNDPSKMVYRLPFFGKCFTKHKESVPDKFQPFAKDYALPDLADLTFQVTSNNYSYPGAYGHASQYSTPYAYGTKTSSMNSQSSYQGYFESTLYGSSGAQSNSHSDWISPYAQATQFGTGYGKMLPSQRPAAVPLTVATGVSTGKSATGPTSTSTMLQTLQNLTSNLHLGTSFSNSQSSTLTTTGSTSITPPIPSSSIPITHQSPLRSSYPFGSTPFTDTANHSSQSAKNPSSSTLKSDLISTLKPEHSSTNTDHTEQKNPPYTSSLPNLSTLSAREALQLKWREAEAKKEETEEETSKTASAGSSAPKKKKKKKEEPKEGKDTSNKDPKDSSTATPTTSSTARETKDQKEPKEHKDTAKHAQKESNASNTAQEEEEDEDRGKTKKKRRSEREQQKGDERDRERERKDRKRRRKERDSSEEEIKEKNEIED